MSGLVIAAAADPVVQHESFRLASQVVNLAAALVATAVLARRRHLHGTAGIGWALAMFGVFTAVLVVGIFPVVDDGSFLRHGYTVLLVSVLLCIPYLLVRFAHALDAVGPRGHRVAVVLTVLQILATVFSPVFPAAGEPRSAWFTGYVVLILVGWTTQSAISALGLWRAGYGQPRVVRNRLRVLATGTIVLASALVLSAGSGTPGTVVLVITTLVGVVGIYLLVFAFVLPGWVRAAWRAPDLVELGHAERSLMVVTTPEQVGEAVVPAVLRLFGATGAVMLDGHGRSIVTRGLSSAELDALVELVGTLPVADGALVANGSNVSASRLGDGWLVVKAGPAAPVFDSSEISLLERVCTFGSLALERGRLFEQQEANRRAVEAAAAELQTLIYSVSHDLRNPILSILGYLDVLEQDFSGQLPEDGAHYLERISVNAIYMQNLIQDLLELSRIGRNEPPSHQVPLGELAASVAQEIQVLHPQCVVTISGEFPSVWMSELRARQLLTNLLENAAKYSPDDPRVEVSAQASPDGGATLLIVDHGLGIPDRHREKAFEVFERLSAATTDIPGTGMGLPICKRIIESVGGSITLEGPETGAESGTTVRLSFPGAAVRAWSEPHTERQAAR